MRHEAITKKIVTPIGKIMTALPMADEDLFGNEKKVYNGVPQKTYSVTLLLEKGDKEVEEFVKTMKGYGKSMMEEAFKIKKEPKHSLVKDGDEEEKEYYHGYYMLKAKCTAPEGKNIPILFQGRKSDEFLTAGDFYSGCYGRMQIALKTYDVKVGGKGVSKKLLTLQFFKDGDPMFGTKGDTLDTIESFDAETEETLDLMGEAA